MDVVKEVGIQERRLSRDKMRIVTPPPPNIKKEEIKQDPSEPGIINPVLRGPEPPSFLVENWWKQLVGHRTHLDYGTCRTGLMTADLKRQEKGRI